MSFLCPSPQLKHSCGNQCGTNTCYVTCLCQGLPPHASLDMPSPVTLASAPSTVSSLPQKTCTALASTPIHKSLRHLLQKPKAKHVKSACPAQALYAGPLRPAQSPQQRLQVLFSRQTSALHSPGTKHYPQQTKKATAENWTEGKSGRNTTGHTQHTEARPAPPSPLPRPSARS